MATPNPPQEQQESISFEAILQKYRDRVSELEHALVLMECRIENRDAQIESLLRQLDVPHN